jgi:hypothetical protein
LPLSVGAVYVSINQKSQDDEIQDQQNDKQGLAHGFLVALLRHKNPTPYLLVITQYRFSPVVWAVPAPFICLKDR